jgi:hypothetical protein
MVKVRSTYCSRQTSVGCEENIYCPPSAKGEGSFLVALPTSRGKAFSFIARRSQIFHRPQINTAS